MKIIDLTLNYLICSDTSGKLTSTIATELSSSLYEYAINYMTGGSDVSFQSLSSTDAKQQNSNISDEANKLSPPLVEGPKEENNNNSLNSTSDVDSQLQDLLSNAGSIQQPNLSFFMSPKYLMFLIQVMIFMKSL